MKIFYKNCLLLIMVFLLTMVFLPQARSTGHFVFEGGDPSANLWTIYIAGAEFDGIGMEAGDEIAVFDGDLLVGVITLTQVCTPDNQFENFLIAYTELVSGPGYVEGNLFTFVAWDESVGVESTGFTYIFDDTYPDAWVGDTFPIDVDGPYSMVTFSFTTGILYYNVTTEANPPEGGTTTGDGVYEEGTDATVIATVIAGYEFIDWTVEGVQVSTEVSYTFTVTDNVTLIANFTFSHFNFEGGNAFDSYWTIYITEATGYSLE